jgi:c-di-GMP-binding flagellar brake protein YcgR
MPNLEDSIDTEYVINNLYLDDSELIINYKNQRKTVRYVRKDITAFVSQADIFGSYSFFSCSRAVRVKLLDISSQGVLLGAPSELVLKLNQKVMLILIFNSNKKFEIQARVKRQLFEGRRFYGVKFDKVNDELGDYLLESQEDLVFK